MALQIVSKTSSLVDLQPREKMIDHGVETLNDVELVSAILGMGTKKMNVKEMSLSLLSEFGRKGLLQFTSPQQVQEQTGLPPVKSCQIAAMAEYFRRVTRKDNTKIKSAHQLYEYLKDMMKKSSFEQLWIVCIDHQRRVLHSGLIAQGKPNTVHVTLSDLFHHPVRLNARNFYLAHSHPNGVCKPSREDRMFTLRVKEESLRYGLFLDDHIIVSPDDFYSFSLQGVL